jgi:hypothetical protein
VLEEETNSAMGEITLTINTGEMPTTRALQYGLDAGSGYENYIDLDSLEIYLCDYSGDGYNVNEFVPTTKERTGDNTYEVKADMTLALLNRIQSGFRIYVIANCGHNYLHSTYNNLKQMSTTTVFDCSSYYDNVNKTAFEPSESQPIPMFGIKSFSSGIDLRSDWNVDLGTIYLIRDMAKVVVKCATAGAISDVKMTKVNNSLTIMPYQMQMDTSQPVDGNLLIPREHDGTIAAPTVYQDIPFNKIDDNTYAIYVPEYRNVSSSNASSITLKYLNNDYILEFKDYSNDTAFNLIRNTIYIYEIVNAGLEFNYVVEPWAEYKAGDISFD